MIPAGLLIVLVIAAFGVAHYSHHARITKLEQMRREGDDDVLLSIKQIVDPVRREYAVRLDQQDALIVELQARLDKRRGKATTDEVLERLQALEAKFR